MVSALNDFSSFDLANPVYLGAITERLDDLILHGLIAQTDKDTILAMGDNLRTRADAAGIETVTPLHVKDARGEV